MEPAVALESFLPTLAGARAAGIELPPGDPLEQHRLAALVVRARVLRRDSWEGDERLSQEDLAQLPKLPPATPQSFEGATHRTLTAMGPEVCFKCGTEYKYGTCPTCFARHRLIRARVKHWTDTPFFLNETYLPSQLSFVPALFSFEGHLEALIGPGEPPEYLRCHDLRSRTGGTAYRGGGREQDPDFNGHAFGDALEKARAAVLAMMSGKVVRQDVKAYAWPFLWLRYGEREPHHDLAIYAEPGGQLHTFAGQTPK